MPRSGFVWLFLCGVGTPFLAANCSKQGTDIGDETHFVCGDDDDCTVHGSGYVCVEELCVRETDAGTTGGRPGNTGGRPGSTGGSGGSRRPGPAAGVTCDDGNQPAIPGNDCEFNGFGGSIAYPNCETYGQALDQIVCTDGGSTGLSALNGYCSHRDELDDFQSTYNGQCLDAPGGLGAPLREDVLCAPGARADIITCIESMTGCPRLPLCNADGDFGCPQIRNRCAPVSDAGCVNAFDGKTYEGRRRTEACLKADPEFANIDTCQAAFYRCALGI